MQGSLNIYRFSGIFSALSAKSHNCPCRLVRKPTRARPSAHASCKYASSASSRALTGALDYASKRDTRRGWPLENPNPRIFHSKTSGGDTVVGKLVGHPRFGPSHSFRVFHPWSADFFLPPSLRLLSTSFWVFSARNWA